VGNIKFKIARSISNDCFVQEYQLPFEPGKTIAGWLTRIQEELDPSLLFPISCRAGLCGGCGLMVNDRSVLSCETMLDSYWREGDDCVSLKPLQGFPVIRDLQIDWNSARDRMKQVIPNRELIQDDANKALSGMSKELCDLSLKLGACITCGLCVSDCPVIPGGKFIEPFIFIKSRKIAEDTRVDVDSKKAMIRNLSPYLMLCIHCGKCSDVCPRALSPEEAVRYLRENEADVFMDRTSGDTYNDFK